MVNPEQFNVIAPQLTDTYDVGLIVPTYNRPKYLRRTLRALRRSDLSKTVLLFVDDVSDNPETRRLIEQFSHPQAPIVRIWRTHKEGVKMHENLYFAWEWLLANLPTCRYFCHLDPDTILKKHWLQTVRDLYETHRPQRQLMVTGFNALWHTIEETQGNYYVKRSIGGLNMFFDAELYVELVRPCFLALEWGLDWDWKLVDAMQEKRYPILCTKPSVIQHIGRTGVWAKQHQNYDFAIDYTFSRRPLTTFTHYAFIARQHISLWHHKLTMFYQMITILK